LEALKSAHAALLAHTRALSAADQPIPEWKSVALHTVEVEVERRSGGYLQHGAQQLQHSALQVLGFEPADLERLEDKFSRVGLNHENKLTMPTLFRYVSSRATPFLETMLFALDDEMQASMSLTVFLRSVGLFCCMPPAAVAQFLFGIVMPTLSNKVPWFTALRRPDGSCRRLTWWQGLSPWEGIGSRSSPILLPVVAFEVLVKSIHAVGSEANPLVHMAVDDSHTVARDGMLDFDAFCALMIRFSPLFTPIFAFQAACRKELGGSKFWARKCATWSERWEPTRALQAVTSEAWEQYWSVRLSESATYPSAVEELRRLEAERDAAAAAEEQADMGEGDGSEAGSVHAEDM
jgi:hypothetical protein